MSRRGRRYGRSGFLYTGAAVVGRVLDGDVQSVLRMLPCESAVSSTTFAAMLDWENTYGDMSEFVYRTWRWPTPCSPPPR
jgi:hypothetical protein